MAQILETVTAKLQADAGQFVAGFNRASHAVDQFGLKIPTANRVVATLQRGMGNLAFAAAGVPGPLGKITESLLAFSGGSALVIGVAAGIGALALAYNKLAAAAENAEKAARESAQRFTDHLRLIAQTANTAGLQARADALRAGIGAIEANQFMGGIKLFEDTEDLKRMRQELLALETQLTVLHVRWFQDVNDDLALIAQEARLAGESIRFDLIPSLDDLLSEDRRRGLDEYLQMLQSEGYLDSRLEPELEGALTGRGPARAALANLRAAQEDFAQLGVQIGRQFGLAFADGFKDIGGLLKSIVLTVFNFALTKGLGTLFPAVPSASIASSIDPASMTLNVNTGALPSAMSPFDVARDAQWQRILRESNIVARSMGAR